MKNHQLPALSIAMLLAFSSCKKTDFTQDLPSPSGPAVTQATGAAAWKNSGNWETGTFDNKTLFSSILEDQTITSAVAHKGLVLVFHKEAEAVHALPFEEKNGTGIRSWYYGVTEGAIQISFEAEGTDTAPQKAAFTYFILSEEQLNDLEAKGYSKEQLMGFSLETATALLK